MPPDTAAPIETPFHRAWEGLQRPCSAPAMPLQNGSSGSMLVR